MKYPRPASALIAFLWTALQVPAIAESPLSFVDPKVGTGIYSGALNPAASLPYSMVKLGPDTTKPSTAGYNPVEPILGFSHTHIGGTGGKAFAGQIRVRPQAGAIDIAPPPSPKAKETASPGYYAVDLTADQVRAELTLAERAGVHRYTFPTGRADLTARILIDITSTINNTGPDKPAGMCVGSNAKIVSPTEMEGSSSIVAGYANLTYTVYFVAVFDRPALASGTWTDKEVHAGATDVTGGRNQPAGVYAEFEPGTTVGLRVGISYTSIALARKNLESSAAMTFDQIRARAESIWNTHLSKIEVEGGTDAQRRQFYTALYHTVLTPIDVTGDNAGWAADDTQSVYWDIYTLWDTFRTTDPLRILIDPDRERGIIRSLLAVYRKTGWLPDAWTYNKMGIPFQGGTHADNVIADAVVKNLGGFDRDLAYAAVRKDATEANPKVSKIYPGTGRLGVYLTLGYVPSAIYLGKDAEGRENEFSCGVSRTLEYAYNDFSAYQVAKALGHHDDAELFLKQSMSAYTLFRPETKLFWGKTAAGNWMPDADPTVEKTGWTTAYYEGSAWQYRFSVPHDIQGLINRLGGDAAFVATLDEYFDRKLHNPGNEPGFLTPWLYDYAGRPDKTVDRVRAILANAFKLAPDGYPGDEDVGAMSAWYLFAAMGFYPNAGQDIYLLASPLFTRVTLKLSESGKTFVILAENASSANKYVQSATLGGKPWHKAWLTHAQIISGGELVLSMGPKPSMWGSLNPPPSVTTRP